MHQAVTYEPTPMEVDMQDVVDARGIRYIGAARRQPDGKYHVLADVGGRLVIAEVSLSFPRRGA